MCKGYLELQIWCAYEVRKVMCMYLHLSIINDVPKDNDVSKCWTERRHFVNRERGNGRIERLYDCIHQ
jgi:hypothetical protein